jgi:hypothetical protein
MKSVNFDKCCVVCFVILWGLILPVKSQYRGRKVINQQKLCSYFDEKNIFVLMKITPPMLADNSI